MFRRAGRERLLEGDITAVHSSLPLITSHPACTLSSRNHVFTHTAQTWCQIEPNESNKRKLTPLAHQGSCLRLSATVKYKLPQICFLRTQERSRYLTPSSPLLATFLHAQLTLLPWRWRQQISPKRSLVTITRLHGFTFQNTGNLLLLWFSYTTHASARRVLGSF
jgi:hypothetical protein